MQNYDYGRLRLLLLCSVVLIDGWSLLLRALAGIYV